MVHIMIYYVFVKHALLFSCFIKKKGKTLDIKLCSFLLRFLLLDTSLFSLELEFGEVLL